MADDPSLDNSEVASRTKSRDPLVGITLDGRYHIDEVLGSGGMSVVYKATQLRVNRLVAIKTLKFQVDEKPVLRERFEREIMSLCALNHPNIVTVYDCVIGDNEQPYVVMDYLRGRSLEALLKDEGPLSLDRFARIAVQVCSALEHAHRKGIIHRDLKPGNIVLMDDEMDFVKVVDFGLAQLAQDGRKLTHTGELWGSPPYMSPEQCKSEPTDERSDIYSLGTVMYEMLTGKDPFFDAVTIFEFINKHVSMLPPPLNSTCETLLVPPDVEPMIFKCMAKSAIDRYSSATEVQDAIIHACSSGIAHHSQEQISHLAAQTRTRQPSGSTPATSNSANLTGPGNPAAPGNLASPGNIAGPGNIASPGNIAGPGNIASPGNIAGPGNIASPGNIADPASAGLARRAAAEAIATGSQAQARANQPTDPSTSRWARSFVETPAERVAVPIDSGQLGQGGVPTGMDLRESDGAGSASNQGEPDDEENICQTCGKLISRPGRMTAWVFKDSRCQCAVPLPRSSHLRSQSDNNADAAAQTAARADASAIRADVQSNTGKSLIHQNQSDLPVEDLFGRDAAYSTKPKVAALRATQSAPQQAPPMLAGAAIALLTVVVIGAGFVWLKSTSVTPRPLAAPSRQESGTSAGQPGQQPATSTTQPAQQPGASNSLDILPGAPNRKTVSRHDQAVKEHLHPEHHHPARISGQPTAAHPKTAAQQPAGSPIRKAHAPAQASSGNSSTASQQWSELQQLRKRFKQN